MRISMRAEKAIEWLKLAQNQDGGIAAWLDGEHRHKSYPEVTGYLIPTLLNYGEQEMAEKCAKWLASIQNSNGSFDGIDGVQRTFDSGAIMEGFTALGMEWERVQVRDWIDKQRNKNHFLKVQPDQERTEFYTMRVEGLLGNQDSLARWYAVDWFNNGRQRTHYLAYGLEGMHALGVDIKEWLEKLPAGGIMPSYVDSSWKSLGGSDTTATAQIGVLRLKCGMSFDPSALYALQLENGGLPHDTGDSRQISWAVKYFLDYERIANAN